MKKKWGEEEMKDFLMGLVQGLIVGTIIVIIIRTVL